MSTFIDECNLHVKAGDGGAGCVAFRRESHVAKGGPAGGDGGDGGSVWLVADPNVASLLSFRDHPHRRAANGRHGQGSKRHGAQGKDLIVPLPVGTVVLDHGDREQLIDLSKPGDRWLAAQAGVGGRGNARFLSNSRRAPSFAEQGEIGQERWLRLELKLLADVAIIGFPNVGKSTLISRISAAKPKIADYPFTTLEPNLGVVRTSDDFEMVVADIPGLIPGASQGKGLGHRFLRHVERATVLLILCDLASPEGISPQKQLEALLNELGSYHQQMLKHPRLVVGSKLDVATDASYRGLAISAVTGEGLPELLSKLATLVSQSRQHNPIESVHTIHRPTPVQLQVRRAPDGTWEVHGRAAERAVALSDLTNPDALAYANKRLFYLGINQALAKAGVQRGDEVCIAGFSFTYEEDL